jgi:hypothetical protein
LLSPNRRRRIHPIQACLWFRACGRRLRNLSDLRAGSVSHRRDRRRSLELLGIGKASPPSFAARQPFSARRLTPGGWLSVGRRLAARQLLRHRSLLGARRGIFPLGRLNRSPGNLPGGQNRNDVSDFAGRVLAGCGRSSPRLHRIIFGNLHNPDVLRDDARPLIQDRFPRGSRLFRLDDTLNLDDFPTGGVRTADILAL